MQPTPRAIADDDDFARGPLSEGRSGRRSFWRPLATFALLATTAWGCGSSSQIETFKYQLADIERQITLLQRESARQDRLDEIHELLTTELATLEASQEEVRADLARLDRRIADLRSDFSANEQSLERLRAELLEAQEELAALEETVALVETRPSGSGGDDSPSEPQDLYQHSYDHFLRGNYTEAIAGFRQYLDLYPNSELADNATYWIGESYFSQGAYEEAVQAFSQVGTLYPNSERIASSLLREGSAHLELGNRARGRRALLAVVERYPQSDEAILARQQLDRLPG